MSNLVGITGSDGQTIKEFANKYITGLDDGWKIISIDEIVQDVILKSVKDATGMENPSVRNPFLVREVRQAYYSFGDDFWLALALKEIEKNTMKGYTGFIITDIITRGEHVNIRDMQGKMIYVNSGRPNTYCAYAPQTVEFDIYIEYDDIEEVDEKLEEVIAVAQDEILEDHGPIDPDTEAVMYA